MWRGCAAWLAAASTSAFSFSRLRSIRLGKLIVNGCAADDCADHRHVEAARSQKSHLPGALTWIARGLEAACPEGASAFQIAGCNGFEGGADGVAIDTALAQFGREPPTAGTRLTAADVILGKPGVGLQAGVNQTVEGRSNVVGSRRGRGGG